MNDEPSKGWRRPDGTVDEGTPSHEPRSLPRPKPSVPRPADPDKVPAWREIRRDLRELPAAIWSPRFAVPAWAVDADPPSSVRWCWIVVLHVALFVAPFLVWPHTAWYGLPCAAVLLPVVSFASWLSWRAHRRPTPIEEQRRLYRANPVQLQRLDAGASPGPRMPFWFFYRTLCVRAPSLLVGLLGLILVGALYVEGHPAAAFQAFLLLLLVMVALFALVLRVGFSARPVFLLPETLRSAARDGHPISQQRLGR